ncbi:MAG: prolyl oligopeptidase family serine peptidase [Clostridia bacterium]|nr:prolyl oligopeptidase family serine peptidase [Clostridia bacterium]
MEKIITYENLRNFAYSNDHLIKGEIKGIMLNFYGLGGNYMFSDDFGDAYEYAEKGIIHVIPYYNPWAWMNRQSVSYTDEIVAVLCKKYNLPSTVKVVSTGSSMGGLSALVYCAYAKITPCACVANCPVCDLVYHYTERVDLPRTLYSAFAEYDGDMDSALRTCSPLHLVDKMPNINYTIYHCGNDKAVNIEKHSKRFVDAMKVNHNINLVVVPLRGHGDLSAEAKLDYNRTILKEFNQSN